MAEIHFCGRWEAPHAKGPWDAIVSINDPDEPTPALPEAKRVLRLEFHDLDEPLAGYLAPSAEHVQQLLDLTRAHLTPDSRVLVHCHAGISRSAAASIILAIALGTAPDQAIDQVISGPRGGLPNPLLLEFAQEPLGLPDLKDRARAALDALKE